jgi:hypothetical protein
MTITQLPTRVEYTATAAQTVFAYTFKIFEDTDLNVYVTPVGQVPNDATDIVTPSSVTGVGSESGGTVTIAATNAGDLVTIIAGIPASRLVDYQNNGDFRPDTVNDDFDRVVSLAKQVEDTANRTLTFQKSEQGAEGLSLPTPEGGKVLRWRADEQGVENLDVTTQVVAYVESFDSIADLRVASGSYTDGQVVQVLGYYAKTENQDWSFQWEETSTEADDGTFVIKVASIATGRFIRLRGAGIYAQWAGVIADGSTNDATALNSLIALIGSEDETIIFPYSENTYLIGTNVTFPANIDIEMQNGAVFEIETGVTITGTTTELNAGFYQIFDTSGGGSVVGTWVIDKALPQWWGGAPATADNSTAFQSAIDMIELNGGGIVWFSVGTWAYTVGMVVDNNNVRLLGESANAVILNYTGSGNAVDFQEVGGTTYPQWCEVSELLINVASNSALGIVANTTHSKYSNLSIFLQGTNNNGIILVGDPGGTGPYYNDFYDVNVQGQSLSGQVGINLFHSGSVNAPNANNFWGGRVGQCETGRHIEGISNNFFGPISESNTVVHFDVQHSTSAVNCTDNNIFGSYIEGGAASTAFLLGSNSIRTSVSYQLGTGFATFLTDTGTDNMITFPGTVMNYPIPTNGSAGFLTYPSANVGIFQYNGSPEGNVTAAPGSICFNYAGGAGVSFYVKESGVGNTGWVAK